MSLEEIFWIAPEHMRAACLFLTTVSILLTGIQFLIIVEWDESIEASTKGKQFDFEVSAFSYFFIFIIWMFSYLGIVCASILVGLDAPDYQVWRYIIPSFAFNIIAMIILSHPEVLTEEKKVEKKKGKTKVKEEEFKFCPQCGVKL